MVGTMMSLGVIAVVITWVLWPRAEPDSVPTDHDGIPIRQLGDAPR
jgi:hypothetical protein